MGITLELGASPGNVLHQLVTILHASPGVTLAVLAAILHRQYIGGPPVNLKGNQRPTFRRMDATLKVSCRKRHIT